LTKILITGSNGQLGKALRKSAPKNIDLILASRNELDLKDNKSVRSFINSLKPDWIINCAAYTAVDLAEKNFELANQVNGFALGVMSDAIKKYGGKLIHISTDFVFDGDQNFPYKPYQIGNPINAYGLSKLNGEKEIEKLLSGTGQAVILRTSWLMGHEGKNFISTIIRLNKEKEMISVVSDQLGSPTSTFTLANVCWRLVDLDNLEALENHNLLKLHWSDSGVASWYDVAVAIGEISYEFGLINKKAFVKPINSLSYKTLAKRPKFSVLDSNLTINLLDLKPIHWRKCLAEVLKEMKN
tara:strand:- start:3169 stop:4065 length:897 start_codon:yes stop_codon:yes gene_type:complete